MKKRGLRAVVQGPAARMQLDRLDRQIDRPALQTAQQLDVSSVLLLGNVQRRLGQQKTQLAQQVRLALPGTPTPQDRGQGEVEMCVCQGVRVRVLLGFAELDMLTQSRQVVQVELTTGKCRQPALEHSLELHELCALLIVAHCGCYRLPALRDERPASSSPTPLEQTVLAHRLQRTAHRDLADAERLRDHAGISEPVPRREVPETNLQCDSGADQLGAG